VEVVMTVEVVEEVVVAMAVAVRNVEVTVTLLLLERVVKPMAVVVDTTTVTPSRPETLSLKSCFPGPLFIPGHQVQQSWALGFFLFVLVATFSGTKRRQTTG